MPADQRGAATGTAGTSASPVLPAAVLWDLDGTLIDSEPYWIAEEFALVESFGGTWSTERAHDLVGNDLIVSAEKIIARTPVALEPLEVVDRLMSGVVRRLAAEIPWRPGARELLDALRAARVPMALVTMSWKPMSDAVLSALDDGVFDVVVTGDMVAHGKPHPEPYETAARSLGVDVRRCVAIEDSGTGATSASAAGAHTLFVPNVVDPDLPHDVRRVPTLVGLTPEDLLRVFA